MDGFIFISKFPQQAASITSSFEIMVDLNLELIIFQLKPCAI